MRQATPSTHLGQPGAPQAKVFWYKLLGQWFLSELVHKLRTKNQKGGLQGRIQHLHMLKLQRTCLKLLLQHAAQKL